MNIRSLGSSALAITFAASLLAAASTACTIETTGTGPVPRADGGTSSEEEGDENPGTSKPGTKSDGGKPSTSTGSSSCQEILSCAIECEEPNCEETCFENGSAAGKAQLEALIGCVQANDCEDDECIIANCGAEYEACE